MSTRGDTRTRALACRAALIALAALAGASLTGCSDPYTTTTTRKARSVQSPGEFAAPPPASPQNQKPAEVQSTARGAILQFAGRYSNWTYQTLAKDQRGLAAISVGAARLTEQQAATASSTDSTLAQGHITNQGQVLGITEDLHRKGWWLVVTSEKTSGSGEYEALPASIHVTLAKLARVRHGFAISQWLSQA